MQEASSSVSYPEADEHGFPHHGILSPQLSKKKQWLIGLQSPAHPGEIMTQILGTLQGLNVRWKKIGLYNMKCILVHTFQDSNDTTTNNHINNHYINNVTFVNAIVLKPQNVLKFEIQMQGVVCFFGRIAILIYQNIQSFHMFMAVLHVSVLTYVN